MLRGGSWNNNPRNVRASNRNRNQPTNTNNNKGFRCSRDCIRAERPVGVERWIIAQAHRRSPGPFPGWSTGQAEETGLPGGR
ncbi:MAG: hypothetical protein GX444_02770 [Myxococcales bacterium]|nr:hypothetical protein [Myxococcales bacterium]